MKNDIDMNIKELLKRELSFEEMNEWLNELMEYSCNNPGDDTTIRFEVYNEEGDIIDFRKHIGGRALNTISGIILLKEKVDESRGEWFGRFKTQQDIKRALGIN